MLKYKKLLLVLLILSINAACYADTITIEGQSGIYYLDFWQGVKAVDAEDTVGEFSITLNELATYAFCVQLGPRATDGEASLINPSEYTINNNQAGLQAAWLMDAYSTGLGFDYTIFKELTKPTEYTVTLEDNDESYTRDIDWMYLTETIANTALQLAIWETIYDYNQDDNNFTGDFFQNYTDTTTSPDYDDENSIRFMAWALSEIYLAELQNVMEDGSLDGDFSGKYKFYVAEFEDKQNLLVAKPIPEPATIMLFGLGLLGISAMGRKRS